MMIIIVPQDDPIANDNMAEIKNINTGKSIGLIVSFAISPTYFPVPSSSLTLPRAHARTSVAIIGSMPDIPETYSEKISILFFFV